MAKNGVPRATGGRVVLGEKISALRFMDVLVCVFWSQFKVSKKFAALVGKKYDMMLVLC
jgi:hypothetical protein